MTRALTARSILVSAILAAIAPAAEIKGPEQPVATCAGLVRVTAGPTSGGRIALLVLQPPALDVIQRKLDNGGVELAFAAPAHPTLVQLACIEVTREFEVSIAQATITIGADSAPPTDPPPADDPPPGRDLDSAVAAALALVPETYRTLTPQIASNFERVGRDAAAGRLSSIGAAKSSLSSANREVILFGAIRQAWQPAFDAISAYFRDHAPTDLDLASYGQILQQIGAALRRNL